MFEALAPFMSLVIRTWGRAPVSSDETSSAAVAAAVAVGSGTNTVICIRRGEEPLQLRELWGGWV